MCISHTNTTPPPFLASRKLFFICMAPGILNGLHVSSYVFLGDTPTNLTCVIPTLQQANWGLNEIHEISSG